MNILALEPYFGGSHQAFLEGWIERSRHAWQLMTLPANKWKWRMRHAAITFSQQLVSETAPAAPGGTWDLLFCSDMLNLAEFMGLAPASVRNTPCLAYFHENQLTYPVMHENGFDYHFAFTNLTTALAAREVWFNSAFHREAFLEALRNFLRRMPDYEPMDAIERIRDRSAIRPPGIPTLPERGPRKPGPLRVLWAARWEHDKGPDTFFAALDILSRKGVAFDLSVVGGGRERELNAHFRDARERLKDHIVHWGYQETRDDYVRVLLDADVSVSTAHHEFFGISMVEAAAAGVYPLVPRRLAYPEVFAGTDVADRDSFFYDGDAKALAGRLTVLAERLSTEDLWQGDPDRGRRAVAPFAWKSLVPEWDDRVEALAGSTSPP